MSHYEKQYEEDYNRMEEAKNKEWEAYVDFCSENHVKVKGEPPLQTLTGSPEDLKIAVNGNVLGKINKAVHSPTHYQFFEDIEAIEIIARTMTEEQFYGYCLGNKLKYKLRAGDKGDATEDLAKANKYMELYNKYKGETL